MEEKLQVFHLIWIVGSKEDISVYFVIEKLPIHVSQTKT